MADAQRPTRQDLALFLPNQRLIRAFERLFSDGEDIGDETQTGPIETAQIGFKVVGTELRYDFINLPRG